MVEDKIEILESKLNEAIAMLTIAVTSEKVNYKSIYETKLKLKFVSSGLHNLLKDIKTEKAIDGCRVRQMEMSDDGVGDCGTDENGKCIGYAYDGEPCEECRTCAYSDMEEI